MMEKEIKKHLLSWYKKNKRDLPWRNLEKNKLPNPYYIFVSEYMLQQTTVSTVKKRFIEFIHKWPSIDGLSKITENKILTFWSGLGYYSRARNLLKSAKIIKNDFKSNVPNNYKDLISLPGVGDYTAKAVLGIAFNQPVIPIDANVERILARLYAYKSDLKDIKKKLLAKSTKFTSSKQATSLIQAFMDYGSIVCTPRNPKCQLCIINNYCKSFKYNLQKTIPLKRKFNSKKLKKFSRAYIFINEKNEILVRKRSSKGMLASMLEVPNDSWVKDKKNLRYDKIVLGIKNSLKLKGSVEYSFSHFDLQTDVFLINIKKYNLPKYKWIKKNKINKSPLPTVMKKIVEVVI